MKNNRLIFVVSVLSVLYTSLFAGANEIKTSEGTHNWVVMDQTKGDVEADRISWSFPLKHSGKYMVQIVFDNNVKIDGSVEAEVNVAGERLKEVIKASYKLDQEVIFEFKKSIEFTGVGEFRLSLSTSLPIKKVRLIPRHSNIRGSGKYHEEWLTMHESPEKKEALKWFEGARFGMFIHWGVYSQASGVWKGTKIEDSPYPGPRVAEWLMSTFRIPRAEYAQLAKSFNPEKSFAENIAKLAKKTGMKYVVITSKHHDGFALFDSKVSAFDIADASPYEGDLIKELYDACLAEGLEFGVYYSHGNDWSEGGDGNVANVKKRHDKLGIYTHKQGKNTWDPNGDTHVDYLENKSYPQVRELLDLLPKLRLIWFDGEGFITEKQSFDFYKMIYDINPSVIVNRRVGYDFGDYLDAGDNVIPSADVNLEKHWETCGTANNSWGYKAHDTDWKSTQELLYYFIDIVSKGGNYLLNIGPDNKGRVPEECVKNFHEVGEWVTKNKEAIFGTKRWGIPHEGGDEVLLSGTGDRSHHGFSRVFSKEDFWFSAKGDKVYVMSLTQAEGEIHILSLKESVGKVSEVRLLGDTTPLKWKQNSNSLDVDLSQVTTSKNGFALEVTLSK